jgi:hypothetical protein
MSVEGKGSAYRKCLKFQTRQGKMAATPDSEEQDA